MLSAINIYFTFPILYSTLLCIHPESCIPLVSLTASASIGTFKPNIATFVSLWWELSGGRWWGRRIRGNRIDYNPLQDALCPDFGFGANPKSNACLRGSIEKGRLGGGVTIHGHMPSCLSSTEVKTL